LKRYSIEIIMIAIIIVVDVIADSLQAHLLGASTLVRVVTNAGVLISAVALYFSIGIVASKKLKRRWKFRTPLGDLLFKQ
jgi:succinate-acetate transporter protein